MLFLFYNYYLNRKIVLDTLRQLTLLSSGSREVGREIHNMSGEHINVEADGENPFHLLSVGTSNPQSSPSFIANVSTDTASESSLAFNSSNQIQQQPSSSDLANSTFVKDFSRLVVVKMSAQSADLVGDGIFHFDIFCILLLLRELKCFGCIHVIQMRKAQR
jgi:hypothetical protein